MTTRGASLQVQVDGRWLTDLATWGDLETIHGWPGDCIEATFTITTKYKSHNPAFHRDAPVIVSRSGFPMWGGLLQEPEWNGREAQITARGWWRAGEDYPAFSSTPLATDNAAVAIDAQNARGLGWTRDASIPNASLLGSTPDRGNTLAALLDVTAEASGAGWGVDAKRRVYMAASTSHVTTWSNTGVDYHVKVGAAEMSTAEDSYASHVVLWYLNQIDVYKATAWPVFALSGPTGNAYEKRWGHRDWLRDITDLGNINDANALALAQTIYNRGVLRPSFTSGVEVAYGELVNIGGVPINLDAVRPNRVTRVHGVRDEMTHAPYTDFVIGKVTRRAAGKTVILEPVGVAAQTDEDIYQEWLEEAWVNGGG